jgi:hypothetical protein
MISPLNEFFDKIYYINLDISPDRNEKCLSQFEKYGIVAERVPGILGRDMFNTGRPLYDGRMGALSSHMRVMKKIVINNYSKALILEDDIVFCDNFNDKFSEYIADMPDDWDMIYLGGNHTYPTVVNKHIIRLKHTLANHAYSIRLPLLRTEVIKKVNKMWSIKENELKDKNLQADVPNEFTIDNILANYHPVCNCYGFTEQLVWQEAGFSITENTYTNFEWILKQKFEFEG